MGGSASRRQRRQMEKAFGLNKKKKNFLSDESVEVRRRKRAAGEEIKRQRLENERNNIKPIAEEFPIAADKKPAEEKIILSPSSFDFLGNSDGPEASTPQSSEQAE